MWGCQAVVGGLQPCELATRTATQPQAVVKGVEGTERCPGTEHSETQRAGLRQIHARASERLRRKLEAPKAARLCGELQFDPETREGKQTKARADPGAQKQMSRFALDSLRVGSGRDGFIVFGLGCCGGRAFGDGFGLRWLVRLQCARVLGISAVQH